MKTGSILSTLLLISSIVLLQSCGGSSQKEGDTPTSGFAKIYVDQTFQPIIAEQIQVFESIYPNAKFEPHYVSETEALNALLKDSTRIIISTRDLTQKEKAFFAEKKLFPRVSKIATDGIALIINKQNRDSLISVDQIRLLLTGKITSWNQLSGGSGLGRIKVIFDHQNSSTVRYLLDSLCEGKNLSQDISALSKNEDVVDFVTKNPNAIGIIGVSWISNRNNASCMGFLDKIRVMAVSYANKPSPDNSYQPYQAYLATKDYPLCRDVFTIATDPSSGLPTGFASFLSSDRGQRIILKSGILPATQPVRVVQVNNENPL
jgi:phosphate transport system substrate-binding protein